MTDRIVSHPVTQSYRDNYDRVFGKKQEEAIGPLQAIIREVTAFLRNGQQDAHSGPRFNDQDMV